MKAIAFLKNLKITPKNACMYQNSIAEIFQFRTYMNLIAESSSPLVQGSSSIHTFLVL